MGGGSPDPLPISEQSPGKYRVLSLAMENLYTIYGHLFRCLTEERKYTIAPTLKLTNEEFIKAIQTKKYIRIDCTSPKFDYPIVVFLLPVMSKYAKQTMAFRTLLQSVNAKKVKKAKVIVVTNPKFGVYIERECMAQQFRHLNIENYPHRIFSVDITKGPHVAKHTIMSQNEIDELRLGPARLEIERLPAILVNDPQCIIKGAEVGDVVKIEGASMACGWRVDYRVVKDANFANIRNEEKLEDTETVD